MSLFKLEIAVVTTTNKPAAGPLTLCCDPLIAPTRRPPHIPEITPVIAGSPEANAIPRHKGSATRNTTSEAEKSFFCGRVNFIMLIKNNKNKELFNLHLHLGCINFQGLNEVYECTLPSTNQDNYRYFLRCNNYIVSCDSLCLDLEFSAVRKLFLT